jgi:hypothetical protein
MLDFLVLVVSVQIAAPTRSTYRCIEPKGMVGAPVVVEEAGDLEEWSGFDEAKRNRLGDRSLRICGASGCAHPGRCARFVEQGGLGFQRLGMFRPFPPRKDGNRIRFLVLAWNDGSEIGELSRSIGGVRVVSPSPGDSFATEFGTISVNEQSQVEIVHDSLLAIAEAEWRADETRYAPHHFRVRAWNLNQHAVVDSPFVSYVTKWRYRSLDDVDTLDVIRHEIPSIGTLLRKGGK